MYIVHLYCDGACSGNPGKGGAAAVLECYENDTLIKSTSVKQYKEHTTNQEMELLGLLIGLRKLKDNSVVRVFSDSAYIVNCINKGWYNSWKSNNWKTSTNKTPSHLEMWHEIHEHINRMSIKFEKVEGHSGHPGNEEADRLAVEARKGSI